MAGGNKIKSENSIGSVEQKDRTMRGGGGGEQHHPHGGGERKQQQLIKEERDSPLRAGGENSDRNAKSNLSMASAAALVSREDKKFTGRCRLFVGNLTPDTTEDEFKKLFEPYGEISEVYVNTAKGFGFIRLDYRHNAEAAKAALDGMQRKGRTLRVRYASLGAALKVKNLSPHVSNELLEKAFSQFGEVERAVVVVDDRGRPTGEGIVEFARKPGAQQALKRITDGVFLITSAPRPVTVEPLEQKDEEDGFPEKFINKTDQYKKEREAEPRFAPPGSFEYEFGLRWKELEDLEKQQHENVKKNIEESRMKLEDEMENAMFEQQAELIRQDLMRQQEELRRLEEMRQQEQIRRRQEMEMRRQEEERRRQDEERRRQDLLMRSQEIRRRQMDQGSLPRRGDEMMGGGGAAMPDNSARSGSSRGNAPPLPPPPAPPAGMGLERPGQNQMPASAGGYNYNQGMAQNIGSSQSGSSMAGAPGSMAGAMSAAPMRQSRYDQASDNNFGGSDNYGSSRIGNNAGPMGNQGPINNPGGPPNLFQSGMGGNMRGGDTNMMDNHRRREGSRRDDYGEMKRMRRY